MLTGLDLFDSSDAEPERPPGPGTFGTVKAHVDFFRDQIGCFRNLQDTYGDVVFIHLGGMPTYVLTDPDLIGEVLLSNSSSFHKDAISRELERALGKGLLTSEDPLWRKQRKLISPALQRRQIAHYADVMVDRTRDMLDEWSDGETRPFHRDMMALTVKIVVQTLFNLDFEDDVERVADVLDTVLDFFHQSVHTPWRLLPDAIPNPTERRFDAALEELDDIIYGLIDARRADATEGDDLLYHLIEAADDDGNQMTDQQLRDEVVTMFLAGHETTALAIMYAWYLMSEHPHSAEKMHAEVDDVLGGEKATAEDSRRLPYTRAVVKETMRLLPPAWIIGREAIEDVQIGRWTIPKGSQVLAPQSLVHVDERWYEKPDEFRPERWIEGIEDDLPRYAYFPFGGGPRVCIGNYFAMMESILVIATMAQHYEVKNVSPEPLRTTPAVTQRPATKIEMRIKKHQIAN
jgi:cytochrome P450